MELVNVGRIIVMKKWCSWEGCIMEEMESCYGEKFQL